MADGQLFTMGHVQGREFVYCLDISNGEIIWQHSYPCQLVDVLHEGGPAATPTIDGDYVYTLGREGQLFCFRTDSGEMVWEKFLQEDLNVPLPEWGFASSVFILGDQLILQGGRVVSYNKLTGKRNWQTTPHAAGYGSAISFAHNDRILLATLDCAGLRVTQSDGEEIAFAAWESPYGTNSTTPIINDDTIYVSSGYDVGCGLFHLQGNSLELIYSNLEMRNHFNNSILYKGYLYGFDGNSNWDRRVSLTCMHFETGEVAWKQGGLGCGSLMVADGKLLILAEDGSLVVAQATPDGYKEQARSVFLEGRCWTVPVLLDQRIYGRNAAGKLVCAECEP
ncbi:MAG: alcohol dehydrogenase [Planctomycetaceae bacterium]|nr:alcohol dehydrogenase [Planctomycetaceae bacterium]MBP62025.1 alcohol dehydrogenase [Planctomycetaceae bacterium]